MEEKRWKCFVALFHLVCWTSTISFISYWVYLFSLNQDLTVMDYKRYYDDASYKYPMLSLCLRAPFDTIKLQKMSTNVNATSYLEFLEGKHFSTEMLQYDYQNIIVNISEYVVNYWSAWRNTTEKSYTPTDYGIDQFKSTFAGFFTANSLIAMDSECLMIKI
jgi:hypothetical protein